MNKGSSAFEYFLLEHGLEFAVGARVGDGHQVGKDPSLASLDIFIICLLRSLARKTHRQCGKACFYQRKQQSSFLSRQLLDPIEGGYDSQGVSEGLWFVKIDACCEDYQFEDAVCFENVTEVNDPTDVVLPSLGVFCHNHIGLANVVVHELLGEALQNGQHLIVFLLHPIHDRGYAHI